ncbi:MAG TPA: hypothetical protein VEU07_15770 [Candidatus Acidoferrum sp.]|nr:hypothetical protein [Candidatus Acidoferrum sp.]
MEQRHVWITIEDRATRVVAEHVLRRAGFSVERLEGAMGLLDRLTGECPDLLILDRRVLVGVMDVLRARLQRREMVPAMIAASEGWALQDVARVGQLGVAVIHQPVRASELLATVDRVLASRQSQEPPPGAPDVLICGFGPHAETLAQELIAAGYQIHSAADGLRAKPLVAAGHFRALLLDLQAAGLAEVTGAVGKLPAPRPVLAVGRMGWGEAGCLRLLQRVSYLEKPLQVPTLLKVLGEVLALSVGGEATRAS